MFIQTTGSPENPPLVLLHGFMGTHADWQPLLPRLAQRFYCLTPDWPGHGRTPLTAADGIGYAQWNAALAAALSARGLQRVRLVGYSLGGRLALDFALRYPQRVQALALLSANPGLEEAEARRQRAAWDEANARRLRAEGLDAFLQNWYDLPLFASLERFPGLKDRLRARRGGQSAEAMAAVIQAMSPGRQPSRWAALHRLDMPVLALAGRLDSKYTRLTARLAAANPRIHAVYLPFAGHALHLERPQRTAHILCAFFNRHEPNHSAPLSP